MKKIFDIKALTSEADLFVDMDDNGVVNVTTKDGHVVASMSKKVYDELKRQPQSAVGDTKAARRTPNRH